MLVFVGCNYENLPFVGYRDAFRELQHAEPKVQFKFADVRISNRVIMEKVREEILNCDVGLYDVTFRNPNVMMELGIAIGAGKGWNILYNPKVDQSSARRSWFDRTNIQLPANLRGYKYLEYRDKQQLKRVLAEWSQQTLDRSSHQVATRWGNSADGMLALLKAEPNMTMNEIASRAGEHIAVIRLTVGELRKKGLVGKTGSGPGTRYFARNVAPRTTPPSPPHLGGLRLRRDDRM